MGYICVTSAPFHFAGWTNAESSEESPLRNNFVENHLDLSHIYWIGGSGCAGKSTVADLLARKYGFAVYHCDEHWFGDEGHFARARPDRHPTLCKVRDMELETWFNLPPTLYVEMLWASAEEDFRMILDDLRALPKQKTVVEGVSILPRFVASIVHPRQTIFLVAYEDFQRKHYMEREFAKEWFAEVSNPQAAFDNLLIANGIQARSIRDSARQLGLEVIVVDEDRSLQDNVDVVERHFGLVCT